MNQTINISTSWEAAFEASIISVSGWRFRVQEDEQSTASHCSDGITQLVYIIAHGYARFALCEGIRTICLGRDSRPSGVYIQKIVQSVLTGMNLQVQPLGIVASPELSNYVSTAEGIDAYVYISASHNPIGYNGFKFGSSSGSVIDAKTLEVLLSFIHHSAQYALGQSIELELPHSDELTKMTYKQASEASYQKQLELFFFHSHTDSTEKQPGNLSIVLDFNGSARFYSIDIDWLQKIGVTLHPLNEKKIAHEIIPEGNSLHEAATHLDQLHRDKPLALCAYVYDCDGDRGNLVLRNHQESIFLDAQTHFALLIHASLERLHDKKDAVIVVNGPTSLCIDAIARQYGVAVIRTEVGEKNVLEGVSHAQEMGKRVVFAGEGSNGGAILPGLQIRDPLVSITTMVRHIQGLITKQPGGGAASNVDIVDQMLKKLPCYITTVSSDETACLRLPRCDAKLLRNAFKRNFETWWKTESSRLERHFEITRYAVQQHVGKASYDSWFCDENKAARGGLSLLFYNQNDDFVARMWFRASGTEPLYRILVDLPKRNAQSPALYDELMKVLTMLLHQALYSVAHTTTQQ